MAIFGIPQSWRKDQWTEKSMGARLEVAELEEVDVHATWTNFVCSALLRRKTDTKATNRSCRVSMLRAKVGK